MYIYISKRDHIHCFPETSYLHTLHNLLQTHTHRLSVNFFRFSVRFFFFFETNHFVRLELVTDINHTIYTGILYISKRDHIHCLSSKVSWRTFIIYHLYTLHNLLQTHRLSVNFFRFSVRFFLETNQPLCET
jgi:hypothetical protein